MRLGTAFCHLTIAVALLSCVVPLLFGKPAVAQAGGERITRWHSAVKVNTDGSLTVAEQISVHAEGLQIKRGIERDFPLRFTDWRGNRRSTSFEIVSCTRGGQREPYTLHPIDNGVRMRIGNPDVLLEHGEHKYVITYRTQNQLYSLDSADLLYWNVTGNEWELAIDSASCEVSLPRAVGAEEVQLDSWTGLAGSTAQGARQELRDGKAWYEMRAALPLGWGMTIALHFPKGLVTVEEDPKHQARVNAVGPRGAADKFGALWDQWGWLLIFLLLGAVGARGGFRNVSGGGGDSSSSGSSGGSFSGGSSGGGGGGGGGRGW